MMPGVRHSGIVNWLIYLLFILICKVLINKYKNSTTIFGATLRNENEIWKMNDIECFAKVS